ncbi:MAG: SPOR domain-containing protein [Pseudomonadota bacterium]
MALTRFGRASLLSLAALALVACDDGFSLPFGSNSETDAAGATAPAVPEAEGETRDVEAPEIFEATDRGLWDGRPSLGGVWVAHPNVVDPERAIIRNTASGEFVIGALFRKEIETPGPAIQVSSDAAESLGLVAGQPVELSIVALRREEVPVPPGAPLLDVPETDTLEAPSDIAAAPLDGDTAETDPLAAAAAAIAEAEGTSADPVAAAPTPPAAPAPVPVAAATPTTVLEKPFIQIGIFSVEENADNTAISLRNTGILPTVLAQESQGKPFWRVIVGPASDAGERRQLLEQIKELGFEDAYFVTN